VTDMSLLQWGYNVLWWTARQVLFILRLFHGKVFVSLLYKVFME